MPKRVKIALRISTSVLVFSGFLALSSVAAYGIALLIPGIFAIFFSPIGERIDAKYPSYARILWAIQMAFFCFLPLAYIALGLLLTVISLVIFLQVILMVQQRSERYSYYVFLMSFFLLLAACVSAPEPMIAVAIFLFLISSIWCFILIRFKFELENTTSYRPDIESMSRKSIKIYKQENLFDSGLIGMLIGISFVSMILSAGLFLVIPRVEAGFLGSAELPVARTGAGSDRVDVAGGVFAQEDQTAVMYVKFPDTLDGKVPRTEDLYWRLFSFANYSNAEWLRGGIDNHLESGIPQQPFDPQFRNPLYIKRSYKDGAKSPVKQEIYIDILPEEGLPALNLVQQINVENNEMGKTRISWDIDYKDFSIKVIKRGTRALNYTAWSEIPNYTMEELKQAESDFSFVAERDYRMLTGHDLLPETQQMVEELIADAPSLYEKVKKVETYLSGVEFTYTLAVPPLPQINPVDVFLNEVRRGHCERFATAMTLMLRSQGIPSRVVSGYRGAEWDEGGESYIVRNSMAHLWVEVLFPGFGWVVFDPSPRADDSELSSFNRISRIYANYALRLKIFWYQNVIQFDRGLQLDSMRELGLRILNPIQDFAESSRDISKFSQVWAPRILNVMLIASLTLYLIWSWRTRSRIKSMKLSEDQLRASQLYRLFTRKLSKYGIDPLGKSAEEILNTAYESNWSDQNVLAEFLKCYNEVRFGMRPFSKADFRQLKLRINNLKSEV